jgi:hypothetical protein
MDVEISGVSITLTTEQLAKIAEETTKHSRFKSYKDINSFEDACEKLGLNPTNELSVDRIKIIIRALNDGWYPHWKDSNEYKYFNYFTTDGGFSFYAVSYDTTTLSVPSALYLRTRQLAEHCAKIALKEYEEYYK